MFPLIVYVIWSKTVYTALIFLLQNPILYNSKRKILILIFKDVT